MFRYAVVIVFAILWACSDQEPVLPTDTQETSLFPLTEGLVKEYRVMEISFLQGGRLRDTSSYHLRTVISEKYNDTEGNPVFLIDRFTKKNEAGTWVLSGNWTATLNNNELVETLDNIPLLKMKFPLRENVSWNPLQYYDGRGTIKIAGETLDYFKNWTAKVVDKNGTWENYTNVTTIELVNFENRLERRWFVEKYANDLGLIYREILMVDTQCFDNCEQTTWIDKAEKGHYIIQTLLP